MSYHTTASATLSPRSPVGKSEHIGLVHVCWYSSMQSLIPKHSYKPSLILVYSSSPFLHSHTLSFQKSAPLAS